MLKHLHQPIAPKYSLINFLIIHFCLFLLLFLFHRVVFYDFAENKILSRNFYFSLPSFVSFLLFPFLSLSHSLSFSFSLFLPLNFLRTQIQRINLNNLSSFEQAIPWFLYLSPSLFRGSCVTDKLCVRFVCVEIEPVGVVREWRCGVGDSDVVWRGVACRVAFWCDRSWQQGYHI